MLNLIKLEIQKTNLSRYLRITFISTVISLLVFISISIVEKEAFDGRMISVLQCFCILICSIPTVMLYIDCVLNEYSTGTIKVLFTYAISRKKLLLAKVLYICLFSFIALIISNCIMLGGFAISKHYISSITTNELSYIFLVETLIKLPIHAIFNTLILFVPFSLGFIKKSKKTTVTLSIILISVMNSSFGHLTLEKYIVLPLLLSILSMFLIYFSMFKAINIDDI